MPGVALALSAAICALALTGCGGAVVDDPGGTSPDVRLNCGGGCIASDTLATDRMTALMFVVDDGTRTQAQAGFDTDGSIFHNVELEGDVLYFVDGTKSTRMALAREGAFDFFQDLLTLGQPYLADIRPQPATARDYQFQLVRSTGVVLSSVTLPTPFAIASPLPDGTFSIDGATVPISLTASQSLGNLGTSFRCTDVNGNQTSNRRPDGLSFAQTDGTGENFVFDIQAFLASLQFDNNVAPPGRVASCDVTLSVVNSRAGTLADGLHAFSVIVATQTRHTRFTLR
jgi:hypothetical protein